MGAWHTHGLARATTQARACSAPSMRLRGWPHLPTPLYTPLHAHTCTHKHTRAHTPMHAHIYLRTYTRTHTHARIHCPHPRCARAALTARLPAPRAPAAVPARVHLTPVYDGGAVGHPGPSVCGAVRLSQAAARAHDRAARKGAEPQEHRGRCWGCWGRAFAFACGAGWMSLASAVGRKGHKGAI